MRVSKPDIDFRDNLPQTPILAKFDRRLIGQAVQNILKNATEGIAALGNSVESKGIILLVLTESADKKMVAIDVIDNGVGFPEENRQRLLEPYMTTRDGGTGLGLAIVQKIFEEHGGSIALLDHPSGERGARVRMMLARDGAASVATPGTRTTETDKEVIS
jgi:two-component system, NtrC family, nitrogen regulation sensor histidine kinase NtrY